MYPSVPICLLFCHSCQIFRLTNNIFLFQCSEDETATEDDPVNPQVDDRFEFDRNECSGVDGKWVFNSSFKPLYSDRTCPYLDRQFTCVKNGRPDSDSDYRHWEWQLDDCILPRFVTITFIKFQNISIFKFDVLQWY